MYGLHVGKQNIARAIFDRPFKDAQGVHTPMVPRRGLPLLKSCARARILNLLLRE